MEDKIEVGEYVSQKEFLKKNNSIVAYALYVQNNIKKGDYARLNTGQIVRVTGIRENNVNKKAIYYGIYDTDWFDSSGVKNFSKNIIDLIEVGDYVNGEKVTDIDLTYFNGNDRLKEPKKIGVIVGNDKMFKFSYHIKKEEIKSIVTKEQYNSIKYEIKED